MQQRGPGATRRERHSGFRQLRLRAAMPAALLLLLLLAAAPTATTSSFSLFKDYHPAGRAIAINGSGRYYNRPLYGAGNGMLVLAGDRPIVKGAERRELGTLMVALSRGGRCGGWSQLDPAARSTHSYRPGTSSWTVASPVAPGLELHMQAAPTASGFGTAVRVRVTGAVQPGDELLWLFGGVGGPFDPKTADAAVGANAWSVAFDRGNLALLSAGFDAQLANDNSAALLTNSFAISGSGTTVRGASSADGAKVISVARDIAWKVLEPSGTSWHNASALLSGGLPPAPPAPPPLPPTVPPLLPTAGLAAHFVASDLKLKPGDAVHSWTSTDGAVTLTPPAQAGSAPTFRHFPSLASPLAGVSFDGARNLLVSLAAAAPTAPGASRGLVLGAAKTIVVVAKAGPKAGGCCNALASTWWETGPKCEPNGLAVKKSGDGVSLVFDYGGENNGGQTDLNGKLSVLSVRYNATHGLGRVNGCTQISLSGNFGKAARNLAIGGRSCDPAYAAGRFFNGEISEIAIYNESLSEETLLSVEAFLVAKYKLQAASFKCQAANITADMVGAKVDLTKQPDVYFSFERGPSAARMVETPQQVFVAAIQRTTAIEQRVQVQTPDAYINAGTACAAAAVDGLWRDDTHTFVHGAMAWDYPLVGWRSEYGGTIFGQTERVAAEGVRMVANQVKQDDPNRNGTDNINFTICNADPAHLLTGESQASRFYGVGRVMPPGSVGNQGMYDMQSQMFTQQIFMWRWSGNTSHEKLLRPGLELHAQWAQDCFDDDKNGLYHSYINTWPTDSVYYNGGESVEETAYMLTTHSALRDMAARAGDEAAAKRHAAATEQIRTNFKKEGVGLWQKALGHPAAWREEVGLRRLRPDAWSYSIFCPIDAGLISGLDAVTALHYTEWGLERLINSTYPGERHWTSNWVPSYWSVRELWPGDNYALALAYFQTGLPDGGFSLLQGNLHHDMFHFMSPGTLGSHNGGTDFNDIVHPAARAIVEGLWGIRPDLPNENIEIAPQLSPDWDNASAATPQVTIHAQGFRQTSSSGTTSLSVAVHAPMHCPGCLLRLVLPLRAAQLNGVTLNGKPARNYTVERGFGQAIVVVNTRVDTPSRAVVAALHFRAAHGYVPAVAVQRKAGEECHLNATPVAGSSTVDSVDDPQGFLSSWTAVGGLVTAKLAPNRTGFAVVAVNVRLRTSANGASTAILQTRLFKLNITTPVGAASKVAVTKDEATAATWTSVDISAQLNGNLSNIFHPAGGYLQPRPKTCSSRIGTDGYSPWTFTYGQGGAAPVPEFFSNCTGKITTPQGAKFELRATEPKNVAFVSQWVNYPTFVSVLLGGGKVAAGDVVWLLISGSTNAMQTRLSNAVIKFEYVNDSTEQLLLVPPLNYWTMTPIGGQDYNYARDKFCLPAEPPPTVQLGHNNRAMVYQWRAKAAMKAVTLEAQSLEVVVGLLAVSVSRVAAN